MDVEEALLTGNPLELIQGLNDLITIDDFHVMVDLAINLQDTDALWYIAEVGSNVDPNIDQYIMEQCGSQGQTPSCNFLSQRGNPLETLEYAIATAKTNLTLYAVYLLYAPLKPENFATYSSREYQRSIDESNRINREVERLLSEASPSYYREIFALLPKRLQTNLILLRS